MHFLAYALSYLLLVGGAIWALSAVDHVTGVKKVLERFLVGCTAVAGAIYLMMKLLERQG